MPNIIINNYCNQKCEYCFAEDNMTSSRKNDMTLGTFIKILQYLKKNSDKNVRLLGGEPLLSKNIKKFLLLSLKGGFEVIIFSNINISNEKIKKIFEGLEIKGKLRINCNLNNLEFYKQSELENIYKNLEFFDKMGVKLILGYNIYNLGKNADFIFELGKKYNIYNINLKITNSSLGERLIIDNSDRNLGIYIFSLIKRYHLQFFIHFGCGLDKNIFLEEELNFINSKTNIKLAFGCEGNIGKFDINTNGSIFKCFPLMSLYAGNIYRINQLLDQNIPLKDTANFLINNFGNVLSNGECIANKKIKGKK